MGIEFRKSTVSAQIVKVPTIVPIRGLQTVIEILAQTLALGVGSYRLNSCFRSISPSAFTPPDVSKTSAAKSQPQPSKASSYLRCLCERTLHTELKLAVVNAVMTAQISCI